MHRGKKRQKCKHFKDKNDVLEINCLRRTIVVNRRDRIRTWKWDSVCVRRISLGGEGNVLYPMLSSYYYTIESITEGIRRRRLSRIGHESKMGTKPTRMLVRHP